MIILRISSKAAFLAEGSSVSSCACQMRVSSARMPFFSESASGNGDAAVSIVWVTARELFRMPKSP